MDSLTPKQQKRLERLAKALKDRDISAVEHLSDIEEKVDEVAARHEDLSATVSEVAETLKKGFLELSECVYEIDPEAVRGAKGDPGEPGADADEEEIIDRLTPVLLSKVPTPQEVAAYVPNLKGDQGEPGKDGADGKPGRDGSADTPLEAATKLNTTRESVEPYVIKGLEEIGRLARIGASNVAAPSASHTALQKVADRVTAIENTPAAPGGVTDVSNADGTLTISPTTGSVVASLALGHANSWTAAQTLLETALGTTTADGWVLSNTTAAANGAQQVTPAERFASYGWNSGGAGSSQLIEFRRFSLPVQGASGATGLLKTQMQRNGGGWSDILTQSTTGEISQTVLSAVNAVTGYKLSGQWGNSTPGTTRAFWFESSAGYNEIDFTYAGSLRQSIIGRSDGELSVFLSGGNYLALYSGSAGLASNTLYSYNTPTVFGHTGYGGFSNGVNAGSTAANTSTLMSGGGTALKVKRITTAQTLDNTATVWLCDASTSAACTGTPSQTACSTYTGSGQATCESHLPCVWNAGSSCSAFDNEAGMTSCSGQAGCSVVTTACTGGDQSSCEANDDAYGGSCSWGATGDCSPFDEGTCNSYAGQCTTNMTACTWDGMTDCSGNAACDAADNTDQATCEAITYFSSCTGNYNTCSGNYNTGSCSGVYGAACSGTVACSSYSTSGACGGEAGCAWTTVMTNPLPDITTCPDRWYRVKNVTSSGADVVLTPYSGQTIEFASTLTLGNYLDSVDIAAYHHTSSCNDFATAGACTPSGCSVTNGTCSYDTGTNECSGNAACTAHNGNQAACEAQTYFVSCDGTYVVSSNWYVF